MTANRSAAIKAKAAKFGDKIRVSGYYRIKTKN